MENLKIAHPSPDKFRQKWYNLNGEWEFSFDKPNFDRKIRERGWKIYSGEWAQHGKWAHKLYEFIKNNKTSSINTCLAGTFDGGIYLPVASTSAMSLILRFMDWVKRIIICNIRPIIPITVIPSSLLRQDWVLPARCISSLI